MCPDLLDLLNLLDLLALPDLNHPNFLVSLDLPGLPNLGPIKLLKKMQRAGDQMIQLQIVHTMILTYLNEVLIT